MVVPVVVWYAASALISIGSGMMGASANKKAATAAQRAAASAAFNERMAGMLNAEGSAAEADLMRKEAELVLAEGELEAGFRLKEDKTFQAAQKMAYIAGGIDLTGSPLLVLQDSINQAEIEMDSYVESNLAAVELMRAKAGIMDLMGTSNLSASGETANNIVAQGNANAATYTANAQKQMIGGISSAVQTMGSYYSTKSPGTTTTSSTKSTGDSYSIIDGVASLDN